MGVGEELEINMFDEICFYLVETQAWEVSHLPYAHRNPTSPSPTGQFVT